MSRAWSPAGIRIRAERPAPGGTTVRSGCVRRVDVTRHPGVFRPGGAASAATTMAPMGEVADIEADYPRHREADVALRDGSTVHVRPVRREDEEALGRFLGDLSEQ